MLVFEKKLVGRVLKNVSQLFSLIPTVNIQILWPMEVGCVLNLPNKSEWVVSDFIQSLKIPLSKLHVNVLCNSLVAMFNVMIVLSLGK